jgi:thiol:disulfide interchange protein DsbD
MSIYAFLRFKLFTDSGIYIYVQRTLVALIAGLIWFIGFTADAAHTRAALILSASAAKPGETITAGVHLKMDLGWHTYWKNPGESGKATEIKWQLPPGITAGEIQWPQPEKLLAEDITTYVYHGEVVLLVPLTFAPDLKPGPREVKAKVSWVECEKLCVPGSASVTATLEVAANTKVSAAAALIETWKMKLPQSAEGLDAHAAWEKPANGDERPLILEWLGSNKVNEVDFFPYASDNFEVQAATEYATAAPGKIRLRKLVIKSEGDWPKEISGVLIAEAGGKTQGFEVKLPVAESSGTTAAAMQASGAGDSSSRSLWQMLLYAFIGGLILNIMPCVLPVIALKILGFVGQAREAPGRVRKLGLLYTTGVLVSFLVLAALVIALKAGGQRAGWGMQFGNPQFIVGFTVLVTLVALNLFGVFEVTLSGRVMGAAGNLASQHGAAGAFFNGVLATVLATPCTAPFLGAALGFAFVQPAAIIILMFLTIGAGLAAPYVMLSWHPAWLKFLPKPGAWMEYFKIAMGFPMLATAMWLFSLTTTFYGERSWWLGIFLVLVSAAAWVLGSFVQRGRRNRALAGGVAVLLLATGYLWVLDGKLDWRSPVKESAGKGALAHAPKGYGWQPWSPDAVTQARAEGRPVIVDFTARWCVTCNATVKPALEREEVIRKLTELKAVALLADNTRFPPAITDELARFNRAGVPLVLVYPRDSSQPPMVLPEPLSPSPAHYSGVILDALVRAAR